MDKQTVMNIHLDLVRSLWLLRKSVHFVHSVMVPEQSFLFLCNLSCTGKLHVHLCTWWCLLKSTAPIIWSKTYDKRTQIHRLRGRLHFWSKESLLSGGPTCKWGGGKRQGGGWQVVFAPPAPVLILLQNGAFMDTGGMVWQCSGCGGGTRGSGLWTCPPGIESASSTTAVLATTISC